jgi:hypothetical protein
MYVEVAELGGGIEHFYKLTADAGGGQPDDAPSRLNPGW